MFFILAPYRSTRVLFLFFVGSIFIFSSVCLGQKIRTPSTQKNVDTPTKPIDKLFIEAEKYYLLEDYDKSLEMFQKLKMLTPNNSIVYYKIASILAKNASLEELKKASDNIQKALALHDKNIYFYLLASSLYTHLGQLDNAIQALEIMIKKIENTELYLYSLADLYQRAGHDKKAIKIYNQVEAIVGVAEISSLGKKNLYNANKKIDEALNELRALYDAFPENESYAIMYATLLQKNDDTKNAISFLENFILTYVESTPVKRILLAFYQQTGNEKKHRKMMSSLINDPTVGGEYKIDVLVSYLDKIERTTNPPSMLSLETMLQLIHQAKKNHSDMTMFHTLAGNVYRHLQQEEEAAREYAYAVQKGSTTFDTWHHLLRLEMSLNALDSMMKHSKDGMELFPNQAIFYYYNGYAYMQKKNYKKAVVILEQANRLAIPNDDVSTKIYTLLSKAYYALKEYEKAVE